MKIIGEGEINTAYLDEKTNRVILVPKRESEFKKFEELKACLDLVDGKIKTLKIPTHAKLTQPCARYPYGALSYSYVPGHILKSHKMLEPKQRIAIGKKLAEFINELHSLEISFNKETEIQSHIIRLKRAQEILASYLTDNENKKLEKLAKRYPSFLRSRSFYLTHGDLHPGNLVVDDRNNLFGVIDFGNMGYYVPEMEFVSMMHYSFDEKKFNTVLENYKHDIKIKDVQYLQSIHRARYFKHSVHWDEQTKLDELKKFRAMLNDFKATPHE